MNPLIILFAIIATISLLTSLGISYVRHKQSLKQYDLTLKQIEVEFYTELSSIDLAELSQTTAGRELLESFVFSGNKEPSHLQHGWANPKYRREMIRRAREVERKEREHLMKRIGSLTSLTTPEMTPEEYRKRPFAE